MYITRRERFSSAHKLINNDLGEKENKVLFSKCNKLHGHNYELFVTVMGKVNKNSGFVMDLADLKKIINEKVIKKLDHNFINEVDFMKGEIASTENLCLSIWKELEIPIQKAGSKLYKIKITETENNSVEYLGDN